MAELEAAANELQAELEPSNSLPSARGARCGALLLRCDLRCWLGGIA